MQTRIVERICDYENEGKEGRGTGGIEFFLREVFAFQEIFLRIVRYYKFLKFFSNRSSTFLQVLELEGKGFLSKLVFSL